MLNGGGGLVPKLCLSLETPWTLACQASLSMGFPRQEYWSGWPFPSPGDLPNPRIEPLSPGSLSTELSGKPKFRITDLKNIYTTGVQQQTRGGKKRPMNLKTEQWAYPIRAVKKNEKKVKISLRNLMDNIRLTLASWDHRRRKEKKKKKAES